MTQNTRKTIALSLLLGGLLLIVAGTATRVDAYSYAAIACVVIAMLLGGYWKQRKP